MRRHKGQWISDEKLAEMETKRHRDIIVKKREGRDE